MIVSNKAGMTIGARCVAKMTELTTDEKEQVRHLAERHWVFLEKWMRMVFTDGFEHGYKHGKESVGK